jgi:hypothetical protein
MGRLTKQGSKYSDEDRRGVVIEYFITGSMTKVAKSTGIPRRTLNDWKNTDWWDELATSVRHEKNEELDANLTKLIDSSFEQAQDRVENGDFRLTKDNELIRVPMGGRDLVMSGAIVYDKRQLHRNQPTSISSKSDTLAQHIKLFEEIAAEVQAKQAKRANSIPGECEEVE